MTARVIVTREWLTHRWQVICPTCGGNDWYPTATFTCWVDAIDHATRHANGHRTHP